MENLRRPSSEAQGGQNGQGRQWWMGQRRPVTEGEGQETVETQPALQKASDSDTEAEPEQKVKAQPALQKASNSATEAEPEQKVKAQPALQKASNSATEAKPEQEVEAHRLELKELADEPRGNGLSMDLLLDISMPVSVELGKASITVQELLKLSSGSVVRLDRAAGEPVDLVVRGVCFARGEVVVAEDHLGLRITEIINPKNPVRKSAA